MDCQVPEIVDLSCDMPDVAYYEYYDYSMSDYISFQSESGKDYECVYYLYTPKDAQLDENSPVIVWVTHGGGVADTERAIALNSAASHDTEAIFVVPWTDRPDGVCAAIEKAKSDLGGIGNFDAVTIQGTSSGGRAIVRAALHGASSEKGYSFRFSNVIAYDPAEETYNCNISGNTEGLKALAEKGTVLFFQTDDDHSGNGGTGLSCNHYSKVYSEFGGTAIVAEINSGNHEAKFTKPLAHNSISWGAGLGPLLEDEHYKNQWYYYKDGEKIASSLEEVNKIMAAARGDKAEEDTESEVDAEAETPPPVCSPRRLRIGRTIMK